MLFLSTKVNKATENDLGDLDMCKQPAGMINVLRTCIFIALSL